MPRRRRFRPNYPYLLAILLFLGAIVGYIGIGMLISTLGRRGIGSSTPYLVFVSRCLDATLAVWFFAVGSSIGSFLNVVAYRLPLGRTLGGHSACPFCTTQIASVDNIPVFAWLRLRGRCRTCRLPISIQYPLVELAVGLIFLSIYFVEFGIAGSNLPGAAVRPLGLGLVWINVPQVLILRVLLLVFVLSGLIAATLMLLRRSQVPLSLFGWLAAATVVTPLIWPQTIVVNWSGLLSSTQVMSFWDVPVTLASGLMGGVLLGSLTLPLIYRGRNQTGQGANDPLTRVAVDVPSVDETLDETLDERPEKAADDTVDEPIDAAPEQSASTVVELNTRDDLNDPAANGWAWIGVVGCLGLLLGWQALPTFVAWILIMTLLASLTQSLIPRAIPQTRWLDPVVWAWLGLVLGRANWKLSYDALQQLSQGWSQLAPLALVLPLGWVLGQLRQRASE